MPEEIIIDISPAGGIKIEAQGFTGSACAKATEQIEIVLGGGAKRKEKPEFSMPPLANSQNTKLTF